jgi:hypothetical protein
MILQEIIDDRDCHLADVNDIIVFGAHANVRGDLTYGLAGLVLGILTMRKVGSINDCVRRQHPIP